MLPKFVHKTFQVVLNAPLLQALGIGDVYSVFREHFELSAQEMKLAYQRVMLMRSVRLRLAWRKKRGLKLSGKKSRAVELKLSFPVRW
jgi:hypothetical protein